MTNLKRGRLGFAGAILTLTSCSFNGGNEMAAIQDLRLLNAAQVQYKLTKGSYAASLDELGPSGEGRTGAGLIPLALSRGEHHGYRFTLTANNANGTFALTAVPLRFGLTGRRTFFLDEAGVIRQNWAEAPADAHSEELR